MSPSGFPEVGPAVPAEVVREVIGGRGRARLVIPVWGGRVGHPVLIDHAFRAELLSLDPARGLRAFFDAHRAEVLRLGVGATARNWRTVLALAEMSRD